MNNTADSPKTSFFKIQLLDNRFPALHGLRMLAMIFVVQFHVNPPGSSPALTLLRSRLWFGMDCFFVMSGFLIGFLLFYVLESKGVQALPRFYMRRFFRISPPYHAVLFSLFFIYILWPQYSPGPITPVSFLKETFFLTNYPYKSTNIMTWAWSLSVEEHFYLLSPLFVLGLLKLSARWRIPLLITLFILPLIQRLMIPADITGDQFFRHVYTATHMRYDSFIAGCLLAYIEKYHAQAVEKWISKPWVVPLAGILGLGLLAASASPFPGIPGQNYKIISVQVGTLTGLAYICLIFWAIHGNGFLQKIMGAGPVRVCATLGYVVYLIHIPVIKVFEVINHRWLHLSGDGHFLTCFVLVFAMCLALAYVFHILIEKPALLLRDKLTAPGPLKTA